MEYGMDKKGNIKKKFTDMEQQKQARFYFKYNEETQELIVEVTDNIAFKIIKHLREEFPVEMSRCVFEQVDITTEEGNEYKGIRRYTIPILLDRVDHFFDAAKKNIFRRCSKKYRAFSKLKSINMEQQPNTSGSPKWITVEDNLPNENGEYNVYSEDYDRVTTMFFKDGEFGDIAVENPSELIGSEFADMVTHWMPLPQPPTEQKAQVSDTTGDAMKPEPSPPKNTPEGIEDTTERVLGSEKGDTGNSIP